MPILVGRDLNLFFSKEKLKVGLIFAFALKTVPYIIQVAELGFFHTLYVNLNSSCC